MAIDSSISAFAFYKLAITVFKSEIY